MATSGDITRCRFPGFQVSYEPKATWKPRKHRKPGNLGNQETWKPGKRFPSSQVSRVPGFLGSQVSRTPGLAGAKSRSLGSGFGSIQIEISWIWIWLDPDPDGNLETWKKVSKIPGFQGSRFSRFPDFQVS